MARGVTSDTKILPVRGDRVVHPARASAGNRGRTVGNRHQIILGIDPGLDKTGYAVIRIPGGRVLDAGLIRSRASLPLARRLGEISEGVAEVLSEHRIDLVAVEDLFAHYQHPRTAILMGHARGVVLLAAAARGVDVLSLPATRIKKSLTGNGHASKAQMQRAIMATFGLRRMPEPADVADALAVASCAALHRVSELTQAGRMPSSGIAEWVHRSRSREGILA